ncbi:MAG TPA: ectonucleotide pyrophosphatase/phosphodiesterase [Candidatus Sulfotelmatobacter sp.]|nr:ectonucleotide pyrophosphatase/phosphodiesterase [Candidatus Sulfotelmatobacter sp.]
MMKLKRIEAVLQAVFSLLLFFAMVWPAAAQQKSSPLLVVISVDGLRPDYVTAADVHGAQVPNLRKFLREGTFAEGVTGVIPTVTYPSHTTLMTGVWPSKHGILANTTFDPLQKNHDGWYWYAEDIRVPTLWDAAAAAGRTTASIQWPVTVGAKINWNIPEVWRAGTTEDAKLVRALSTPGLLAEAKAAIGEYRGGIEATPESDEVRGKYAVWILENKRPGLLTLHLLALDHVEHETQPFSPKAIAVLERLDAVIGKVREAAERTAPGNAFVAVVSDHGFTKYDQQLNLFAAFRKANLFSVDDKGKISDWRAVPWETGGSAAIVLKDPRNALTLAAVRALLAKLAADPANGIDRVVEAQELHRKGGYPNASFFVGLKPGWRTGSSLSGPVVSSLKVGGTHGQLPDLPDMRAAFFLVGPGVPAEKNLGLIDMRDIAPTLAKAAGLALPSADGKPLLP